MNFLADIPKSKPASADLDIFSYEQAKIGKSVIGGSDGSVKVGLPLQLGMYRQFPLWAGFFESIGFEVIVSEKPSSDGQKNDLINSFCYPARLMNCHIQSLIAHGVNFVFQPCESFIIDERCTSDCFNCPLIAYYPELLRVCNDNLTDENFITPYLDFNKQKNVINTLYALFKKFGVKKREVASGLKEGITRLKTYRADVKSKADEILYKAEKQGKGTVILAGRPYYTDNAVNHGINKLLLSCGVAVLSLDSISDYAASDAFNQWTYLALLYRAAEFAASRENIYFVHLTSVGCRYDEIISDELKAALEKRGKKYIRLNLDKNAARG